MQRDMKNWFLLLLGVIAVVYAFGEPKYFFSERALAQESPFSKGGGAPGAYQLVVQNLGDTVAYVIMDTSTGEIKKIECNRKLGHAAGSCEAWGNLFK